MIHNIWEKTMKAMQNKQIICISYLCIYQSSDLMAVSKIVEPATSWASYWWELINCVGDTISTHVQKLNRMCPNSERNKLCAFSLRWSANYQLPTAQMPFTIWESFAFQSSHTIFWFVLCTNVHVVWIWFNCDGSDGCDKDWIE